jgi:DNA repair protein RadC
MKIQELSVALDEDYRNILVEGFSKDYKEIQNLDSPKKIVQVMNEVFHLSERAEEYVYLVCMTVRCRPICFFEVAHGTCNAAMIGIREIFVRALLCGAAEIVLVHNHPGGLAEASKEDMCVTEKVQKASDLIGISFCDHIIISQDSYYSFAENDKIGAGKQKKMPDDKRKLCLQKNIKKCLRHFSPLAPIHGGIRGFFLWRFPA